MTDEVAGTTREGSSRKSTKLKKDRVSPVFFFYTPLMCKRREVQSVSCTKGQNLAALGAGPAEAEQDICGEGFPAVFSLAEYAISHRTTGSPIYSAERIV